MAARCRLRLTDKKSNLENYVRKQKIPWPQYFDGKMWDNEIAKNFALRQFATVAREKGIAPVR